MSKVRPLVVNRVGNVVGDDGKRLYGMDAGTRGLCARGTRARVWPLTLAQSCI